MIDKDEEFKQRKANIMSLIRDDIEQESSLQLLYSAEKDVDSYTHILVSPQDGLIELFPLYQNSILINCRIGLSLNLELSNKK